jgi:hypothetical protein
MVCGCATFTNYVTYDFEKDKTKTTSVGAEMITWSDITRVKGGEVTTKEFTRSLTYSGKQGSTIRILYREYSNDYARPAFNQELTYDLTDNSIITFRNVRIGVIEANSSGITFMVLQHPYFAYVSGQPITPNDPSKDIFKKGSGTPYKGQ